MDKTGFKTHREGYRSESGRGCSRISSSEATPSFLEVVNMSATMAWQEGRAQLEQSDMRPALNIAKRAAWGFSCTTDDETQYLINTPHSGVWEDTKQGVALPGYSKVKAALERHPAMVLENQMDGCLPCQNGPPKNLQRCWRHKRTCAPSPDRHRQPTPEPSPPPPRTPPTPPGDNDGVQGFQIEGVPPGHVYIPTPLSNADFLNLDAYALDSKCD